MRSTRREIGKLSDLVLFGHESNGLKICLCGLKAYVRVHGVGASFSFSLLVPTSSEAHAVTGYKGSFLRCRTNIHQSHVAWCHHARGCGGGILKYRIVGD